MWQWKTPESWMRKDPLVLILARSYFELTRVDARASRASARGDDCCVCDRSDLHLCFLISFCETLYTARAHNEVTASSQSNPVITMNVALMSPRAVCQRIPFIRAASHKPAGISSPPRGHQLIVSWAFSPTYSSVQAPPSRALVHIPGPVKSRMSQDGTDRQSRILLQLFAHFKDGVECQASAACGALAGPYGGAGGHLLSSNSLLWLNMCD